MTRTALAIIAAMSIGTSPLLAAEARNNSDKINVEIRTDTMHKSDDGTLQGKPVVDGPADWSHLGPGSSSTGAAGDGGKADKD